MRLMADNVIIVSLTGSLDTSEIWLALLVHRTANGLRPRIDVVMILPVSGTLDTIIAHFGGCSVTTTERARGGCVGGACHTRRHGVTRAQRY